MTQKTISIICLFVLVGLIVGTVSAQYITMANPGGIAERDIAVYYGNGTLAGLYNSTSTIELDGTIDYIFTMKPLSSNPLEDPGDWLTGTAFPFLQSNAIGIVMICAFIGMIFWRR